MYIYKIGDLIFQWEPNNISIKQDDASNLFLIVEENQGNVSSDDEDNMLEKYIFKEESDDFAFLKDKNYVYRDGGMERYLLDGSEHLLFHWGTCRYGYSYEVGQSVYISSQNANVVTCKVNPKLEKEVPLDISRLFSTLGFHSIFLQHDAIILHSSYIVWNGEAILFTAPSGTGKSTQADLWAKYADAEIMNGDRTLVKKKNGVWYAYGYPCCGSSNICRNETYPIRAIVVLEQGRENRAETMTRGRSARAIVSGTQVYTWNMKEIDMAIKIGMKIASELPVLKLTCRPDQDAVETLKHFLENEICR